MLNVHKIADHGEKLWSSITRSDSVRNYSINTSPAA